MTTTETVLKAAGRISADLHIVDQITDRQHVSQSNLAICRAIFRGLSRKGRALKWRETRKVYYAKGIIRHANNRDLYDYVMRGGF